MKATLTVGISASGKSTWAAYECSVSDVVNINRDDLRFDMFCNGVRDWSLYKFTKDRERQVTKKQEELIAFASAEGRDVIISDTNINQKTVASLTSLLESYGYTVELKHFPVDVMESLKRDAARDNGVGYKVIMDQYKRYCGLVFGQEYHKHTTSKKDAVIFDVDGTLADMTGIRTPFQWDLVKQDKPHKHVVEMVQSARDNGYGIIFLSGRDAVCLEDTRQWLDEHTGITDAWLFMRSVGDMRKDTIIKKEIFYQYINNNFNIHYVVDDRPSVLRMWKYEVGLNIVAVGDPWQEF